MEARDATEEAQHLLDALDILRDNAKQYPSRELSLAITKLQETVFWLHEDEVAKDIEE